MLYHEMRQEKEGEEEEEEGTRRKNGQIWGGKRKEGMKGRREGREKGRKGGREERRKGEGRRKVKSRSDGNEEMEISSRFYIINIHTPGHLHSQRPAVSPPCLPPCTRLDHHCSPVRHVGSDESSPTHEDVLQEGRNTSSSLHIMRTIQCRTDVSPLGRTRTHAQVYEEWSVTSRAVLFLNFQYTKLPIGN